MKDKDLDRHRDGEEIRASGQTARTLGLISYLINQTPPIKAAFMHVCRPGSVYDHLFEQAFSSFPQRNAPIFSKEL